MPIANNKPYKLLVEQFGHEMGNYYFYLNIAAHYENLNYNGFAKYFKNAAQEEKEHADKIFSYLAKKQYSMGLLPMPTNRPLPNDMTDKGIAQARLKLEEGTTEEWNRIYEAAKGKYGVVSKNGKSSYGELEKCEPSIVQDIATEFIKIQDLEEQESWDYISKLNMSTNVLLLDAELLKG